MTTCTRSREWMADQVKLAVQEAREGRFQELGLDNGGRPPGFSWFGTGATSWTCPVCGTVRTFTPVTASGEPQDLLCEPGASPQCPCIAAAEVEAIQRATAQHRPHVIAAAWGAAHVPERYAAARFSTFTPRPGTEAALAACRAYAATFHLPETRRGLCLVGSVGSGKTHLAVATAAAALERTLAYPLFVNVAELLAEVQRGEAGRFVNMRPVDDAARAELLILDDLGQAPLTDLGHRCVWQLVSGRYDACLPTLITTNASDAQLEERLSPAIVSRLYEMTRGLELTASDYRLEMAGRAASTPVRPAKAAGGLHRVK